MPIYAGRKKFRVNLFAFARRDGLCFPAGFMPDDDADEIAGVDHAAAAKACPLK